MKTMTKKSMFKKTYKKPSTSVIKKEVKRIIAKHVEYKQYAAGIFATTAISNTVTYNNFCLNPANSKTSGAPVSSNPGQQGVGGYQHIGNQYTIKQINVKLKILQGAGGASSNVRVMLVQDISANGILPVPSEFLYDVSAGNSYLSPYKVNPDGEYRVLFDKTYFLNQYYSKIGGVDIMQANGKLVVINKKNLNIKVQNYPDTTLTTYQGVSKNSIWLMLMSSDSLCNIERAYWSLKIEDS